MQRYEAAHLVKVTLALLAEAAEPGRELAAAATLGSYAMLCSAPRHQLL
jgi:hypothetical protein